MRAAFDVEQWLAVDISALTPATVQYFASSLLVGVDPGLEQGFTLLLDDFSLLLFNLGAQPVTVTVQTLEDRLQLVLRSAYFFHFLCSFTSIRPRLVGLDGG